MNVNDAIALGEAILETIENDISESARDRAGDFFEGIEERVGKMLDWMEEHQRVTPKMISALENMESAVNKWVR